MEDNLNKLAFVLGERKGVCGRDISIMHSLLVFQINQLYIWIAVVSTHEIIRTLQTRV